MTHALLSPRIRRGEEVRIHSAAPGEDRLFDDRPDGVSTLRSYLQSVWRRKWIALAPLVLIPLVTLVASLGQRSLYEATADVLVNRQEVATTTLVGETPALDDPGRTMATQARLARVPVVIERTLAAAGESRRSRLAFEARSSVFSLGDFLRFVVSDHDRARAARLADTYAREFVRYRHQLDTVGLASTLAELQRQIGRVEAAGQTGSPLYVRLADREQQLESLKALRRSNVSVVETATPADAAQVAPRPLRNTALAVIAGLVLGLIFVFLWETLSTKPRSEGELENLLDMPLLGRLRLSSGDAAAFGELSASEMDAVHTLRTNLELVNANTAAKTIMITSPHAGEGKSAVAGQLAVALARVGRHVVLADLDLRDPSLTRRLGLIGRIGMTSVARDECDLAEALVAMPLDDVTEPNRHIDSGVPPDAGALLEALGSGSISVHPAEFVSSTALEAVLAELERRADIVLVDVPPLLDAPDAAALSSRTDGVLLVVSSGDARGPMLAETRRVIDTWAIAKLGFALVDGGDERPNIAQFGRSREAARAHVGEPERVV